MSIDKLIESLVFLFSVLGACILILTFTYLLSKLYHFIDLLSKDTNKKLIKDTLKEIDKK